MRVRERLGARTVAVGLIVSGLLLAAAVLVDASSDGADEVRLPAHRSHSEQCSTPEEREPSHKTGEARASSPCGPRGAGFFGRVLADQGRTTSAVPRAVTSPRWFSHHTSRRTILRSPSCFFSATLPLFQVRSPM